MKKVFALFLSLMMLFSLAACGEPTSSAPSSTPSSTPNSDPDPVFTPPADLYELLTSDLLNEMAEKETGATLDLEMALDMDMDGSKESLVIDMTVKATDFTDITKGTAEIQVTMQTSEGPVTISVYLQDGFAYADINGEKGKVPMPDTEQGGSAPSVDIGSLDEETKALLQAAKVQSGSAGHSYELELDGDMINGALQAVLQGFGDALPLEDISIGDITLAITVSPENKRLELNVQGGLMMQLPPANEYVSAAPRIDCTVEMNGRVTYGDVSVQMPSDLDEYPRQLTEEDYQLIYGMLFDENGNLIENNEIAYNLMCSEYSKEFIDEFIEMMQQEG